MGKSQKKYVFAGHIVNCKDLDSGDQFNVEVLINEAMGDKIIETAIGAASKSQLVAMSGNAFEYEYLQPSGKVVEQIITKESEVISETNEESLTLLETHSMS